MMMRFLYWFYFLTYPVRDIPEFNGLPYEKRMRVAIDAQQVGHWDQTNERRWAYWVVAFLHVQFVAGLLFFLDRWTLGLLLLGGTMGWFFYLARQDTKAMRQLIRRILSERAKAKGGT